MDSFSNRTLPPRGSPHIRLARNRSSNPSCPQHKLDWPTRRFLRVLRILPSRICRMDSPGLLHCHQLQNHRGRNASPRRQASLAQSPPCSRRISFANHGAQRARDKAHHRKNERDECWRHHWISHLRQDLDSAFLRYWRECHRPYCACILSHRCNRNKKHFQLLRLYLSLGHGNKRTYRSFA